MNFYGHDLSLFNFGLSDPTILDSLSHTSQMISSASKTANYVDDDYDKPPRSMPKKTSSPPKHRHDGTSPLPLGMDWSLPPRKWDGRNSVWPHDFHTGWSYCVTIPSWIILPKSRGSDPVVFYRVQVGLQSPEGITTTRGILRRFNDFLKLYTELKKEFPKKDLPLAPPKSLLRMKNRTLLEERRSSLEDWMEKLLSDIDLSRSAPVATFVELEAAVRSSFYYSNQNASDVNSSTTSVVPLFQFLPSSNVSLVGGTSSFASDYVNDSAYETSELGTPRHGSDNYSEVGMENTACDHDLASSIKATIKDGLSENADIRLMDGFRQGNQEGFSQHKMGPQRDKKDVNRDKVNKTISKPVTDHEDETLHFSGIENSELGGRVRRLLMEGLGSDASSVRASDISNLGVENLLEDNSFELPEGAGASKTIDVVSSSDLRFPSDLLVALPSNERHKMNRVLITMQRRIASAKTDMEDLLARLNQELTVRQYLTTKVKDLEVELETTKQSGKENLQQAILIERERFTQTQWDTEELRRKCMEMEFKLKSEQDEKVQVESIKVSVIRENEMLLQELDGAREQLKILQTRYDESELKSKADIKLLVKEVKSLRSSQLELKQELSRLTKEKLEVERILLKEKQRMEHANAANATLLHECEILQNRLEECSVNFLIGEEDKLIVNTSSPSDAIDLLTTSDNRISFLLAEAQLLSQDVENTVATASHDVDGNNARATDDELRKMLTDVFINNARLRKQVNSVLRCALSTPDRSEKHEIEAPSSKSVLGKFLER